MTRQRLKTAVDKLAIVHRDIRISEAAEICVSPGGENFRSAVFARSVFQRYGYGAGRWYRPEYIFRMLRFLQNTLKEHRQLSHVFNRNIMQSLIVRSSFNLKRLFVKPDFIIDQILQTNKNVVQSNDGVKAPAVLGEEKVLLRLTHAQNIVQWMTKRNVRIEENRFQQNTQRIFDSLKPEYLKQTPFVTRESRKPVETLTRDDGVQEQPKNGLQHLAKRTSTGGKKSDSREINSVNIEGLTDQIVRSIDQRIIAQRERMGRG